MRAAIGRECQATRGILASQAPAGTRADSPRTLEHRCTLADLRIRAEDRGDDASAGADRRRPERITDSSTCGVGPDAGPGPTATHLPRCDVGSASTPGPTYGDA